MTDRAPPGPLGMVPSPNPPLRIRGFFFKRKSCTQCLAKLLKQWDRCPYCLERYGKPKKAPAAQSRTQAMQIGQGRKRLLGWVVPVLGAQRGELYTLAPKNVIGNGPACTIVLHDPYLSARHIEIAERDGRWMLRDLGSKNGTLINDKPAPSEHELVDSDFIGIGRSVIKFKCFEDWHVDP